MTTRAGTANHSIDRVTIRCSDEGGVRQQRLRTIADRDLPRALERLLPDGDLEIDTIIAPLDFCIDDYDDDTVAWRWAAIVANEVVETSRWSETATTNDDLVTGPEPGVDIYRAATPAVAGPPTTFGFTAPDSTPTGPNDPPTATLIELLQSLQPNRRAAVVSFLHRLEPEPNLADGVISGRNRTDTETGDGHNRQGAGWESEVQRWNARRWAEWVQRAVEPLDADQKQQLASAAAVAAQAPRHRNGDNEISAGSTNRSDRRMVTAVGGLGLFYPWLGRYLDRAWARFDSTPECAVAALTALVGARPSESALIHDPLITVLAGAEPDHQVDLDLVARIDPAVLTEDIEAVWERFVGSLRGSWSTETIGPALILRPGWLERGEQCWELSPEPRPLDFLLDALPYPMGSFRLPWTELITMRWKR